MDGDRDTSANVAVVEKDKNKTSFEAVKAPSLKRSAKNSRSGAKDSKTPFPRDDRTKKIVAFLLIVFVLGFAGGWLGSYSSSNNFGLNAGPVSKETIGSATSNKLIPAIATNVGPSVVSIDATSTTQTVDIFGNATPSQQESLGTGTIISSSGYILTNRHVVPSGVTSVKVTLSDGTVINNVRVIGETSANDPLDIAFLKIDNPPEALQPALLGNSSNVQIGDGVVAIGNALGQFQNTVTSGIISGRGRTITAGDSGSTTSEDLQDLFQTDAAINQGNSGGPLVNTNSEVIGINTAIASGAQNIGFSIPINDIVGLIKGVFSTGKIERPYLGVYYVSLNPSTAKQYNVSQTNGAYIPPNQNNQSSILPNSPASDAGLRVGDVITAVNGVQISDKNSLSSLIDQNEVGTNVKLTVVRNGSTITVPITVGNDPNL